jgi:hypothetical protein
MSYHEMLSPQISADALIKYQRACIAGGNHAAIAMERVEGVSLSINSREAPANDRWLNAVAPYTLVFILHLYDRARARSGYRRLAARSYATQNGNPTGLLLL